MLFEGFEYGATGLVDVRAVAESAIFAYAEYLREVVRNLVEFHIHHAEAFDARSVDEVGVLVDGVHFAEGGGVHALVVIVGDLSSTSMRIRNYLVDYGAFANARVARKECDFAFEERVELVNANALSGRDLERVVAD